MDIETLRQQFDGRKFGELILHHYKSQELAGIVVALQGVVRELPSPARGAVESWIDENNPSARYERFWQQDCGEALVQITGAGRARLEAVGVQPSADDEFNMFQIIVLNFAYSAHKHPQSRAFIQKALGVGFLGRLFS